MCAGKMTLWNFAGRNWTRRRAAGC